LEENAKGKIEGQREVNKKRYNESVGVKTRNPQST
jgi:hypothetical protein